MFTSLGSFWNSLGRRAAASGAKGRVAALKPRFRPRLEALEQRLVLSGFSAISLGNTVTVATSTTAQTALSSTTTSSPQVDLTRQLVSGSPVVQQQTAPSKYALVPQTTPVLDDPTGGGFQGDQAQGKVAFGNKASEFRTALGDPLPGFEYSRPSGGSRPTPDGLGLYQVFQGGSIYWSPATAKIDIDRGISPNIAGAHAVMGPIRDTYLGASNLGFPTTDTYAMAGRNAGAVCSNFYNPDSKGSSTIVYTPGVGAFVVSGAIRQKWLALGGGNYGVPTGFQEDGQGVLAQNFRWGGPGGPDASIVSSDKTGTHDVVGAIRDRWVALGTLKFLGTPTTDSTVYSPSGNYLNEVVHFRKFSDSGQPHDAALGTSSEGTFVVYGEIYTAWFSVGGEKFGIPTSDESPLPDLFGRGPIRDSYYLNANGIQERIIWDSNPITGLLGEAIGTHFQVDTGDGRGLVTLSFTPRGGPTGFEPVAGATGTTSTPLKADAPLDLSVLFQDSTHATDTTGLHSLDLSNLFQDSTHATANLLSPGGSTTSTTSLGLGSASLQATSTEYADLLAQETQPVGGDPLDVSTSDAVWINFDASTITTTHGATLVSPADSVAALPSSKPTTKASQHGRVVSPAVATVKVKAIVPTRAIGHSRS